MREPERYVCQSGGDDYLGPISLPSDAGGDVCLFANCNGFNVNGGCNAGGSQNAQAQAQAVLGAAVATQ